MAKSKKPTYSELEKENATLTKLMGGYVGAITELTEQNKKLECALLRALEIAEGCGWEHFPQSDIDEAYGAIK